METRKCPICHKKIISPSWKRCSDICDKIFEYRKKLKKGRKLQANNKKNNE